MYDRVRNKEVEKRLEKLSEQLNTNYQQTWGKSKTMKLQAILDDTDKKILKLLCEGHSPKEIAHKIWKSPASVKQRLANLRKYHECKTTYQLIAKLNSIT